MKITKSKLFEIIDSNGELIGSEDIPHNGANLETQANNTTDYNVQIGTQPFRYDMLGRFGFTLLPFMEGKENQGQSELLGDLVDLMYDRYAEILKFYYKNPNKLKSDFRKLSSRESDPQKEVNFEYAKKIIKVIQKHFENAFKEPKQIDESSVVEDRVVKEKSEDEMSKRSKDGEVSDKQVEKIAGLINKKFDKEDIDKLINLLERRNG